MLINIPTSKDIYIEIAGIKVAVVQSYKIVSSRENTIIKEIGNDDAVCIVPGNTSYNIELNRVYFISSNHSPINFFDLVDFTIVVVKPDKRIHYTGCQWVNISEGIAVDGPCMETIHALAAKRTELTV